MSAQRERRHCDLSWQPPPDAQLGAIRLDRWLGQRVGRPCLSQKPHAEVARKQLSAPAHLYNTGMTGTHALRAGTLGSVAP